MEELIVPPEKVAMRRTTTVTEKKLAANRLNAKRSTGPRTERGKNTSRFNAATLGLFAKEVVIPICDGDGSADQFSELLADLEQEFQRHDLRFSRAVDFSVNSVFCLCLT